jgi:mannan endo-1,4-beta-mannosidase
MVSIKNFCNILFFALAFTTCQKVKPPVHNFTQAYSIYDGKIYKQANPVQLIGANALHSFAAGSADMPSWKLNIVREFVGNINEQPIAGWPIQTTGGAWLHSLQAIVDSNRRHGLVTILCPFGFNGTSNTLFTGTRPSTSTWYNTLKTKLAQWATHFKNQPDVWIEVYNEPYRYDRADGYTDAWWTSDMNALVNVIRQTGNQNIILVPVAEQGQDESVLINVGNSFLNGKANILFDVHVYEKWLLASNIQIETRVQNLINKKLPIFWGEIAPLNAGVLMNPNFFMDAVYKKSMSMAAWLWKYDGTDPDALLNANGTPNNNSNNNWGTSYFNICQRVRIP